MSLAKAFLILVVFLIIRNDSCGNSSCLKVFLFVFHIFSVSVLFLVVYLLVYLSLRDNLPSFIILLHFFEKTYTRFFDIF